MSGGAALRVVAPTTGAGSEQQENELPVLLPSTDIELLREMLLRAHAEKARRGPSEAPDWDTNDVNAKVEAMPEDADPVELRIQLSESRTDAKFERVLGEMRTGFAEMRGEMRTGFSELRGEVGKLATRIAAVEKSTSGIRTTVILTGIAAVGVVVAVLAYGQSLFANGLTTRDQVRAVISELHLQAPFLAPSSQPPAKP